METRIGARQTHTFPANTINGSATLQNRHNVQGTVTYRVGTAPQVRMPFDPGTYDARVQVNGQQFMVNNGLPNSIYCVYE